MGLVLRGDHAGFGAVSQVGCIGTRIFVSGLTTHSPHTVGNCIDRYMDEMVCLARYR